MPPEAENVLTVGKIRELYVGCCIKKISLKSDSVSLCFVENQTDKSFNLLGLQNFLSSINRVFHFKNNDGFTALVDTNSLVDSADFLLGSAELMRVNL